MGQCVINGRADSRRDARGDDRHTPAQGAGDARRGARIESRGAEQDRSAQRTARYSGDQPDRIARYGTQPGGYAQDSAGGTGGGAYGIEAGGAEPSLSSSGKRTRRNARSRRTDAGTAKPRAKPMMGGEGMEESLYMSDGRGAKH